MSRRKSDQIDFGSDSFLDIIANIVGILIILIVIAGLRVSQAPVASHQDEASPQLQEAVGIVSTFDANEFIEPNVEEPEEEKVPEVIVEVEEQIVEELAPIEPDPELQQKIEARKMDLAQFQDKIQKQKLQLKTASQNSGQLKLHLANVSSTREITSESVKKSRMDFRINKRKLDQSRYQYENLTEKLVDIEKIKAPTRQIKHHFSPVSQEVKGEEIHFRLANNQVSHIPIERLLGDLKKQIYRQRNWLVKFNQHKGEVGPVDGFSMTYIVGREKTSVLDELREGQGSVRIGVKEWILKVEPGLKAESAEAALKRGSRFQHALQSASGDATLTFWVYPDSYNLYRKIQSYAHDQHFQVAARPLPHGIPIAGSPSGSRSSGQ